MQRSCENCWIQQLPTDGLHFKQPSIDMLESTDSEYISKTNNLHYMCIDNVYL